MNTGVPELVHKLFQSLTDSQLSKTAYWSRSESKVRTLTFAEFRTEVAQVHQALLAKGYSKGQRAILLSESRIECPVVFMSCWSAGLTVVPVDAKLTAQEIAYILSHAEPSLAFVSQGLMPVFEKARTSVSTLQEVIVLGESFDELKVPNDSVQSKDLPEVKGNDLALIVYTSGTLGNPKGVMITYDNLLSQVRNLTPHFKFQDDEVFLSMLPMNHLFELTGGFLFSFCTGSKVVYANTLLPNEIIELLKEHQVTHMITVPLFLDLLYRNINRQIEKTKSRFGQALFRILLASARIIPSAKWRRMLFSPIHRALGGRLRCFVAGGAPLRPEIARFFHRIGIIVYQGYGLTETSPVISVNTERFNRFGSVGRPLEDVEVRIVHAGEHEPYGEIHVRGPNVMSGYFRNEEETRQAFSEDSWFQTGDLGYQDSDGYLWITGRKKSLIVLGGGKKVAPEEVETVLAESTLFSEVCVMGLPAKDGTQKGYEQVVAIVRPEPGLAHLQDAEIKDMLDIEIQQRTQALASYKRPARLIIMREEFPKTPSRKIKRHQLVNYLNQKEWLQ